MGRSCPIEFKLSRKVSFEVRNILPVQEGHIDTISFIICTFCQTLEGIVWLTSNLIGLSGKMPIIYYRSKKDNWHDLINYSWFLSKTRRICLIDFKLGRKIMYDTRNPLPVQQGRIDMISLIIHEFCQIWEGIVRLTSNLVGRSIMMTGIHYRSKKDVLTWSHWLFMSFVKYGKDLSDCLQTW